MLFRSSDLVADFERLTKNLNFGPEFDKAVDELSHAFTSGTAAAGAGIAQRGIDAVRSADKLELFIDLPGVDPDTVDLTVDSRVVTVSTHRDFTVADGAELVHAGRRHGTFTRTFHLGDDLDVDAISASSDHGVLIVTVPVVASAKPRKIPIQ